MRIRIRITAENDSVIENPNVDAGVTKLNELWLMWAFRRRITMRGHVATGGYVLVLVRDLLGLDP